MSDANDPLDIPTTGDAELVDALLARAGADVWVDIPADLEDAVLAAIPRSIPEKRVSRPRTVWWLAAAAAILMVVAGVAVIARDTEDDAVFSMAGTENAPDASAEVEIAATPVGFKLLLDPEGLPGAPEGTYYEAWVGNGEEKVSAGTFHLRGGEGAIELWAGVADPDFTMLAVTLEPLDGDLDSSGNTYLRGTFNLDE